jgi:hypothetical protein
VVGKETGDHAPEPKPAEVHQHGDGASKPVPVVGGEIDEHRGRCAGEQPGGQPGDGTSGEDRGQRVGEDEEDRADGGQDEPGRQDRLSADLI